MKIYLNIFLKFKTCLTGAKSKTNKNPNYVNYYKQNQNFKKNKIK